VTFRRHRLLPHTADLRVEVVAPDVATLCARCVEALFSLVTDRRRVRPREERVARVEGDTDEERLFLLLRAALGFLAVDRFLARTAHVTMEGRHAAMTVRGEALDASRHALTREIKAVTAHALTVARSPRGVLARFVVDV